MNSITKLFLYYLLYSKTVCVKWRKPFFALLFIYGFAINAIVRANYNYIDDLGRVAQGYRGWDNFSRFTSEYLSIFIHTNRFLNDISPLPQYLAVFLLAISSLILIVLITDNLKFTWWSVIAVIPLGLSPYFLECLSYKYDSPYMALSVLASIGPLIFMDSKRMVYTSAVFIGTLIMCTTYQVSSGIFVLCSLFVYAKRLNEGVEIKDVLRGFGYSITPYLAGIFVFRKLIMRPVDDYVSTSIASNSKLIATIINNLSTYYNLLYNDSPRLWVVLLFLICILFLISFVYNSKINKPVSLALAITLLIIGSAISYGGYVILQKPLFAPRGMYGIGIFLALVSLLAVNSWQKNCLAKIVCLGIAWTLVVFSFTYGNALAEQKRYTDFRAHIVLADLAKLPDVNKQHVRKMQLKGNIGKSPIINRMASRYKILDRLIPTTLGAGWSWSEFYLYNYFVLQGVEQVFSWGKDRIDDSQLPVFTDSLYHTIKANDKYIVVQFK